MKHFNSLLVFSLVAFFTSCNGNDDNNFRIFAQDSSELSVSTEDGSGDSTPENKGEEEEEVPKKKCVEFEYHGLTHTIDIENDIMTIFNYDKSKLEDFVCDDGKLVFCHVPPGNDDASHFIEVDDSDETIVSHLNKVADGEDDIGEEDDGKVYSYILKCDKYDYLSKKKRKKNCAAICE